MSAPSDTLRAPSPQDVSELPIKAGDAMQTVLAAFANLTAAVVAAERVAAAAARALDEAAPKVAP